MNFQCNASNGSKIQDFKRTFVRITFLAWACTAFLGSGAQGAPPETIPRLTTDADKIRFLLYVRESNPSLFEQSTEYKVDLFGLLDEQEKLKAKLREVPEYRTGLRARPPLQSFETRTVESVTVTRFQIRPEAVESWKSGLSQELDLLNRTPSGTPKATSTVRTAIVTESNSILRELSGRSSSGLITGLALSLPPEERAAVLRAPSLAEKTALLLTHLPDTLPPSFKGRAHGLADGSTKSSAIDLMTQLAEGEKRLASLALLHAITLDTDSLDQASARLAQLSAQDLDLLMDRDYLKPKMDSFTEAIKASGGRLGKFDPVTSVQGALKAFSSQVEESTQKFSGYLRIVEVPPEVAIFRGCAGGDCSTRYSFPYPHAPTERVFMIYGKDGALKGYASGNTVESNGMKSFYLMTINGPRMSSADTELLVATLEKEKTRLGVEQILLPTSTRLKGLVEFTPIREPLSQMTEGATPIPIRYLDPEVRRKIEDLRSAHHSLDYDLMRSNPSAVVYQPKTDLSTSIVVKSELLGQRAFDPTRVVTRLEYLELALGTHYTKTNELTTRILAAGEIPTETFNEFVSTLDNSRRLPLAQYDASVQSALERVGASPEILKKKPQWTSAGTLHAPDLANAANENRIVETVINHVKFHGFTQELWNFVNHYKIGRSQKFQEYLLREIASGNDRWINRGSNLFQIGLPVEFRTQVLKLLEHPTPAVRVAAVRYLGEITNHQLNAEEIEALLRMLKDPSVAVEAYAIFEITKHPLYHSRPEVENLVLRYLDNDKTVVFGIAHAIELKLKSDKVISALTAILEFSKLGSESKIEAAFYLATIPGQEFRVLDWILSKGAESSDYVTNMKMTHLASEIILETEGGWEHMLDTFHNDSLLSIDKKIVKKVFDSLPLDQEITITRLSELLEKREKAANYSFDIIDRLEKITINKPRAAEVVLKYYNDTNTPSYDRARALEALVKLAPESAETKALIIQEVQSTNKALQGTAIRCALEQNYDLPLRNSQLQLALIRMWEDPKDQLSNIKRLMSEVPAWSAEAYAELERIEKRVTNPTDLDFIKRCLTRGVTPPLSQEAKPIPGKWSPASCLARLTKLLGWWGGD